MEDVLNIENLHVNFRTRAGIVRAVRGVSFSLRKGEILGVVGESGSGKSATALSALGLLASNGAVREGRVMFAGADLTKASESEMRKVRGGKISMIFQDPMSSLNPLIPVGKQVKETLLEHAPGLGAAGAKKRAIELLSLVRIPEAEKRYGDFPHQFSGGMRQRVMIAIALACEPDVIIADEPTTALDVTIQDQILRLLKNLQREFGTSVIFITHDLGVVSGFCTRVIVMYGGMVMEEALIGELFEHPAHPYTRGLLNAAPRAGQMRSVKLAQIPGSPPDMLNPPPGCPFAPRCAHAIPACTNDLPGYVDITATHRSMCRIFTEEKRMNGETYERGKTNEQGKGHMNEEKNA